MQMFHLKWARDEYTEGDSTEMRLLDPVGKVWFKYTYPGYSHDAYFVSIDTGHTSILGRDNKGYPDFIRISYAHGGAIFIHLNPFAFMVSVSCTSLFQGSNQPLPVFRTLRLSFTPYVSPLQELPTIAEIAFENRFQLRDLGESHRMRLSPCSIWCRKLLLSSRSPSGTCTAR